MIMDFFRSNEKYLSAEYRNKKTEKSSKSSSYADHAICYVQLKRDNSICTVKANITPEHKVRLKPYRLCAVIDEEVESIISCECLDCPASEGGCKHATAFLFWLHRRSEEPSVTAVECYWKASNLAKVDSKRMKISNLFGAPPKLSARDPTVLTKFLKKYPSESGPLFQLKNCNLIEQLSMHKLAVLYSSRNDKKSVSSDNFINFLKEEIPEEIYSFVEEKTRLQADSRYWHELRFGRITASILYETAKCKTAEGSLFEKIFGGQKVVTSEAINRGKKLEILVLENISNKIKKHVTRPGLFLNKDYPIFGASPDGLTDEIVIEIKCPIKESTIKCYVDDVGVKKIFWCQIQLQMFMAKRNKGLFCIASPNFEDDGHVTIHEIEYDENIIEYMVVAEDFWKTNIFPKLISK